MEREGMQAVRQRVKVVEKEGRGGWVGEGGREGGGGVQGSKVGRGRGLSPILPLHPLSPPSSIHTNQLNTHRDQRTHTQALSPN